MIRGSARTALRRLPIRLVFLSLFSLLFLSFGVTIAAVTVLTIHKYLRPSLLTDFNYTRYNSG
jgi:hypothetical protein